jgi:hypothetical protein
VREHLFPLAELIPENISAPWVLVIGGVSRDGNRRARRAAREAASDGLNVLWLDGYEETYPGEENTRVPIEGLDGPGSVIVAGFRLQERSGLLNRLSFGSPKAGATDYETDDGAEWGSSSSQIRRAITGVRKALFRKINQVFRGYLLWRLLRPTLAHLHDSLPQPRSIVYCDDYTIPAGWHAARIWDVPIGMEHRGS